MATRVELALLSVNKFHQAFSFQAKGFFPKVIAVNVHNIADRNSIQKL
jgi:hypothetical protein